MSRDPGRWWLGSGLAYGAALLGRVVLDNASVDIGMQRAFDSAAALVWGAVLLGAIARSQAERAMAWWRLSMLVYGAGLAAAGLWLVRPQMTLDDLAAALLGLALAAILPRLLPSALTRRWLGR